tara:strand:+ start:1409 stop:2581 length:1173 start_codon:yes stop_codon:yes gene_type:complete
MRNEDKINISNKVNGKGTKNTKNFKGKSFGYQVLGFGSGSAAGPSFITATGGTIVTCGNFKAHVFTGPGTFCVSCAGSEGNNVADYVVVAGGGGGGNFGAGGGGAGGFRMSNGLCLPSPTTSPLASGSTLPISAQGYPITVGGGGAAGTGPCDAGRHAPATDGRSGSKGSNSVFSSITSAGGGGGAGILTNGCGWAPSPLSSGGSGGGSKGSHECGGPRTNPGQGMPAGAGNTPPVSPPQGNPGGKGYDAGIESTNGGGGGGASAPGLTTCSNYTGAGGGAGSFIAAAFIGPPAPSYGTPGPVGSTRYFAGGGGGGSDGKGGQFDGTAGPPGVGGGGSGGRAGPGDNNACLTAGTTNTGGGGGGGGFEPAPASGAAGGSGIVIIRYKFQE